MLGYRIGKCNLIRNCQTFSPNSCYHFILPSVTHESPVYTDSSTFGVGRLLVCAIPVWGRDMHFFGG